MCYNLPMKILIPELENPIVQKAIQGFPEIEFINTENLNDATEILAQDQADSMISGLDYSSRDVLIAYKNHLPLKSDYLRKRRPAFRSRRWRS